VELFSLPLAQSWQDAINVGTITVWTVLSHYIKLYKQLNQCFWCKSLRSLTEVIRWPIYYLYFAL